MHKARFHSAKLNEAPKLLFRSYRIRLGLDVDIVDIVSQINNEYYM